MPFVRAPCLGGCGSFYAITIASEKLKGLPILKQHRRVKEVLKDDMGGLHGLQVCHLDPLTMNRLTYVYPSLVEGSRFQLIEFHVSVFPTRSTNRFLYPSSFWSLS